MTEAPKQMPSRATTPETERDTRAMLKAARIEPRFRDVVAGDPALSQLTGGRAPSGVPLNPPKPASAPSSSNRPQRSKPRRPKAAAPQRGERRPRRERRAH